MGSLLATLTTILVAVLAALVAVPYFVNWNDYRDVFEAQAAKLFGRAVQIQGDIGLTILPIPTLDMREMRVADEYGSFARPFAETDKLHAVLSLPALLSGTVDARRVELERPVIRLAVDGLGDGNWQSVRPNGFILPVAQVILNKLDIHDGTVEFRRGKGTPASRIDRITGTFVADSLTGPFRFNGLAAAGGESRELRLSGGIDKSALRLKGWIRSATGASIYQLDGEVRGFDGPLQYSGPIVARLALDKAAQATNGSAPGEPVSGKAIELSASSTITLNDVKLENMAFTLTQNDKPQSLSGSAYASWGDKPRLDIAVDATWFDIDQMLRVSQDQGEAYQSNPAAALAALPHLLKGWSFQPRHGSIKAKFQQANLGGDLIEGLNFVASHDIAGWKVDTLVAKLPGDTDIDIKGTIPSGDALALAGEIKLSGKNLPRLLRWAAPSLGAVDAGDAPRFSLSSGVTLASSNIAFKSARGELGDSTFSGDLVYDFGEASQLVLNLQSQRLDLRNVFGGRDLASSVSGKGASAAAKGEPDLVKAELEKASQQQASQQPTAKASLADVALTVFKARRSQVSVNIAHLQLPTLEARDVRSSLRYEDGTFDIRELNLATTDGLSVKADGRITDFDQKPNGALNLSIDAPSALSVANLARLAGLDSPGGAAQKRIDALAPLNLAGSLNANKQSRTLQLSLAGKAAGSELAVTGKLDGDFTDVSNARLDISALIGNADGRRLIAQLAPEVPLDGAMLADRDQTSVAPSAAMGSGALKISVSGAMKSGLASRLDLRTPDVTGRFDGKIAPLGEPWSLQGDVSLRAAQAATALSLLRLSPGGTPVTGALDLNASLAKNGSKYQIGNLDLLIGGETIGGSLTVDASGARPYADIDIGAGAAVLPKLAAYLVDWDRKDLSAQLGEATSAAGLWPSHAFSFKAFDAADGSLKLKATTLNLTDDLALTDAQLQASLKAGVLTVTRLNGQIYGGAFSGSGSLTSTRGRLVLDARAQLDKADLAAIAIGSDGKPLTKGKGDLEAELHAEGLSPRGLMSVASGKGQLRIQKGTLSGLSPVALRDAADAFLAEEIPQKDRLVSRINTSLRKGAIGYPTITAPIAVKDGVLRLQDVNLDGTDYTVKAGVMVDLAALRLDSEWEVVYSGKSKSGEKLPAVHLVFAGPVEQFASLQPQISTEQLERYLSMRRMEQDMDRLEKLNGPTGQSPRDATKLKTTTDNVKSAGGDAVSSSQPPTLEAPQDRSKPLTPSSQSSSSTENQARRTTSTQETPSPWTTGTEDAPSAEANKAAKQGSEDFEARIRNAIGRSQSY